MNRNEYMLGLEKALKENKVADIEEILAEYAQHFDFKMADGYSEEEVAARLAAPDAIARQFTPAPRDDKAPRKSGRPLTVTGLVLADITVALFFVLLYAWVLVMGALSVATAALAVCLIGHLNIAGLIPPMPYYAAAILGVSMAGLSVLSWVGTVYCAMYTAQLQRAYGRWHKNTIRGGGYPALSKHPDLSGKRGRRLRNTAMVCLIVFAITSLVWMFLMFAYTDFAPFWHALGWFQP